MTLHLGYMRIMNFNVCLFLCCSSSSYSNLCVGFHVNLFYVCAKKSHAFTPTRVVGHMPTHPHVVRNARPHAHMFYSFFSVLLWKEWVLHNIIHSFLLGYYLFSLFFLTNVENGREKLGKNSTSFFANFVFRVCHKIE